MNRLACWVAGLCSVCVACGDSPSGADAGDIITADAPLPDAPPPPDAAPAIDVQTFDLGPAVGLNRLELRGGNATFTALAPLINMQLDEMVDSGSLLLAIEFRSLDDPSGQDDAELQLGFYQCTDPDLDPGDNFDADTPDRWIAVPTSQDTSGAPLVQLDATVAAGHLQSSGDDPFTVPGLPIPLVLSNARLEGVTVASSGGDAVAFVRDGTVGKEQVEATLEGDILATTLGASPNPAGGFCPGNSLLDLLTFGCSTPFGAIPGSEPDRDLDEDGLERFFDTCAEAEEAGGGQGEGVPDAGVETEDGVISCCLDGDGETIIAGADCWMDARIADAFSLQFEYEATRIILLSEIDPG